MTVTAVGAVKRLVVGRPLRSTQLHETLLPKWLALPVFCSDPISSVAYATEQIVLVLAAGGALYLHYSWWVAAAVTTLLLVVVASYRQTCHAYPNGGGAFAVSLANFGPVAALVAASALLVDYVMTVAVSVVSGVLAVTSAAPSLDRHTELLSVACVVVLVLANLRGVRESGRAFAVPTYAFITLTLLMFVFAAVRAVTTGLPDAATATQSIHRTVQVGGLATMLLVLRAFASGCTALTGVEAISNGVPSFRRPKADNAAATLAIMGALAVTMFVGVTALALHVHAHAQPDGTPSVISQVAAVSFGSRSALLYYGFQAATAAILILAANTAFNGFPVLSSILAQERYLPRQLHNRGDKLVFSNGIILLAGAAVALILGFHANLDHLLQLYIIGVFTSFTLSQAGMVRHWNRQLRLAAPSVRGSMLRSRVINAVGAVSTGVVLVVVVVSKVQHGAWIAIVAMVLLFMLMRGIRQHYDEIRDELDVTATELPTLPSRNHALVLVSRLHLPTVRAVAYARATRPSSLAAVTVDLDEADTQQLMRDWQDRDMPIPLVAIESPYREIVRPLLEYVRTLRSSPRDVVTVFIPEYVVGHWWEQLLHNQSALRLKARLLFEPGVMVTSVPWQMRSTEPAGSVRIGASTPGPEEGPWPDDRSAASR